MTDKSMKGKRLGTILIRLGVVTEDDIERALEIQRGVEDRIGEVLLRMGVASKEDIERALEIQHEYPVERLGEVLVRIGAATEEEVTAALKLQEVTGEKIGVILMEMDVIDIEDLNRALDIQAKNLE